MNRRIFLTSLAAATAVRMPPGFSQTPPTTNLDLINGVPSRRQKHFPSDHAWGSSAEIHAIGESYYNELTRIGTELLKAYYQHGEFPKDGIFSGLESHAEVLAGVDYPMSATTGCSAYDALLLKTKTKMAEELIEAMARAIYLAASQYEAGNARREFSRWLKRWNAAKSKS